MCAKLYDAEFWASHYLSVHLQKSAFRFPLSIIISRVQRFRSAMERFELFEKIVTSKQKQLSKIRLRSFVA